MALRDIIILPDTRLRLVSKPVKTIDKEIKALVADMFETMYDAPGIGLAAIQVAVPARVVTMDLSKKEGPQEPYVFINPEILWKSEERSVYEEGCLSIPEFYADVTRSSKAMRTRSRPKACSPPACSTRSTTSTACCSSTIFRGSSARVWSRSSRRRRRRRRRLEPALRDRREF